MKRCTTSSENQDTDPFMEETSSENANLLTIDVRLLISAGKDPFPEIMKILKTAENKTLLIINSFLPVPLIELLRRKGFESRTEKKNDRLFLTYFAKKIPAVHKKNLMTQANMPAIRWEEALIKYKKKDIDIDVSKMKMPFPFLTILNALSKMNPANALLVLHRKVPHLLLAQLTERGYKFLINDQDSQIKILLFKDT